jgi:hypothetical protein
VDISRLEFVASLIFSSFLFQAIFTVSRKAMSCSRVNVKMFNIQHIFTLVTPLLCSCKFVCIKFSFWVMMSRVPLKCCYRQVFYFIVQFVSVYVVNNFSGKKRAAKMLFHYNSMGLVDLAVNLCSMVAVYINRAFSLFSYFADIRRSVSSHKPVVIMAHSLTHRGLIAIRHKTHRIIESFAHANWLSQNWNLCQSLFQKSIVDWNPGAGKGMYRYDGDTGTWERIG